jgi:thiol-disulfide isomerase/thioredoxin
VSRPSAPPEQPRRSRRVVGPFTLGHLLIVGGILLGAAALLAILNTPIAAPVEPTLPVPGSGFYELGEPTTGLAVGQRAPELEGDVGGETVTLLDLDGRPIRLADRRGSPVWLSFFATWCPPCQEETPILRRAHELYADQGLEMIAVSVQETTAADVADYAQTYGLPYTIGFDGKSSVFRTYQGFGLPTHVFLDGEGVIQRVHYGPLDLEQVQAIVEPLLGAG